MDGQVKRAHHTIDQTLKCLLIELNLKQSKLVKLLPFVEFAIYVSIQASSGLSLQQLVFGQVLQAPVDLVEGLNPIEAAQSCVSKVQDVVE